METSIHTASSEAINAAYERNTHTVVITYSGYAVDQHGTGSMYPVQNTKPFKVVDFNETNDILNRIYHETNVREGDVYDAIVASRANPEHTRLTLSVGDIVTVDCIRYVVCEMGFACIDNVMVDVKDRHKN